jgi:dTDP-4-dehydro-6-deoxy-alpha-D-glucopyranose 2,3-dehydratase
MNLKQLRKKIYVSQKKEDTKIGYVLSWLKKRVKEDRTTVSKVHINKLKDWNLDKNGNLYHKSKQFFSIQGVKVLNSTNREVSSWDQPLLFQKHGGILAIIVRDNDGIIEFLLNARREPGDGFGKLKLCPSFSATQSNMNQAHGGKKTEFTDIILDKKNLISKTVHFEEGARFWKKPNQNLLIFLDKKNYSKVNKKNLIWLNLTQIKKLNLKKGIINPFVKTILFMI